MMTYCGSIVDDDIVGIRCIVPIYLTHSDGRPCLVVRLQVKALCSTFILQAALTKFSSEFVLHLHSLFELLQHSALTTKDLTHVRLSKEACLASGWGSIEIHSDLISAQ